jgi:large subunit ribosomal protein L29
MKAKDIRAMDGEKRNQEIAALLKEQFNLRLQKATGQAGNTARLRSVRRDLARFKTVMNEKANVKG